MKSILDKNGLKGKVDASEDGPLLDRFAKKLSAIVVSSGKAHATAREFVRDMNEHKMPDGTLTEEGREVVADYINGSQALRNTYSSFLMGEIETKKQYDDAFHCGMN